MISQTFAPRSALLLLLLFAAGCAGGEEPAAEAEHGHEHGGGMAVTLWTDKTELFFEYPPMVAGQRSEPWAVHLTRLEDFKPVTEGTLTLHFQGPGGQTQTFTVDAPSRPGIFGPTPELPAAGAYDLVMTVGGPQVQDSIQVGPITVYASADDVPHEEEEAASGGISFLKEQQWPIDFAVAQAEEREVPLTVQVSGELVPAAGGVAQVSAPVSGLVLARGNVSAPAPGTQVRQGQTLAVLSPAGGDNSYARTKSDVERLRRELERAERLFKEEAIPEKRLIEARHALEVAEAALEAMGGGGGDGYNYPVRAPIAGVVNERHVAPGARVEAGDLLYTLVNPSVVWLQLRVPARYAAQAAEAREVVFSVEGSEERYRSEEVVSAGVAIDPATRTLPLTMAIRNADGRLKIGMFAEGLLRLGGTTKGVAVPSAAIQNEDGQPVAYVQVGGETFERRLLRTGATDGTHTLVSGGVKAGEHVVTVGAYQVYLASLSTSQIGDHGHAH